MTFRHVLLPVDLSDSDAHVAAHAGALARLCRARLTLLHVHPAPLHSGEEDAHYRLLADLSDRAARLDHDDVSAALAYGEPTREIVSYAARHGVDVLVLPAHHRGPADRILLQSVSADTSRKAECSVLAVPDGSSGGPAPRQVLCALALTGDSFETLEAAATLARATHARLTLLHVIGSAHAHTRRSLTTSAIERVSALLARATVLPEHVETAILFGQPEEEILRLAELQRAGLLVVGAPRTRWLGRTWLGRTAAHALRESACPVLLVRGARARPKEPALEDVSEVVFG